MDWAAWSREAASLMSSRTTDLLARYGLTMGSPYQWNLDSGEMVIGGVSFPLVTVGTVSGESFLWAWANEAIPSSAKRGLERVRQFGEENDLALLFTPCASGGLPQAKECLAIAGRVLDASGAWIDRTEGGHIAFVLHQPT
jgi:hypothetical protein